MVLRSCWYQRILAGRIAFKSGPIIHRSLWDGLFQSDYAHTYRARRVTKWFDKYKDYLNYQILDLYNHQNTNGVNIFWKNVRPSLQKSQKLGESISRHNEAVLAVQPFAKKLYGGFPFHFLSICILILPSPYLFLRVTKGSL